MFYTLYWSQNKLTKTYNFYTWQPCLTLSLKGSYSLPGGVRYRPHICRHTPEPFHKMARWVSCMLRLSWMRVLMADFTSPSTSIIILLREGGRSWQSEEDPPRRDLLVSEAFPSGEHLSTSIAVFRHVARPSTDQVISHIQAYNMDLQGSQVTDIQVSQWNRATKVLPAQLSSPSELTSWTRLKRAMLGCRARRQPMNIIWHYIVD